MKQHIKQRSADIQRGNVPAGYKRTKLGIIPQEWKTPRLSSVLSEREEDNCSGQFGKDDVLSVSGEFGVTNQIELLGRSFAGASTLGYHVVEFGNIVYTKSPLKSNPYGIIKLNRGKTGIVSPLYAVYDCKTYEIGAYLDYYFSIDHNVNSYLHPLVRKGTKNTMNINDEDALKGNIILPPEEEIAKIVEILGCCDRVIALKKELIAEKKRQKQALMQKLLDPDNGFRLPGFSKKWISIPLEDCGSWLGGGTPSKHKPEFWENGTIKWISSQEVKSRILRDTTYKITEKAIQASASNVVPANSLIFVTRSGVLRHSFPIAKIKEPMAINQDIRALTPNTRIEIDFLHFFLEVHELNVIRNYVSTGTTVESLRVDDFKKMRVWIPERKEQQVIVDVLSAVSKEIDLLEQELLQEQQKKKSLMQLLLTGIVRV